MDEDSCFCFLRLASLSRVPARIRSVDRSRSSDEAVVEVEVTVLPTVEYFDDECQSDRFDAETSPAALTQFRHG